MSFRIGKHTALLANGFRSALGEQTRRAIKDLDLSAKKAPEKRIHSARKRIKKVRAVLRLLQDSGFSKVSETDYNLLRDASAEISSARDADANVRMLKKLCKHFETDRLRFSQTFDLLEKRKKAALQNSPSAMHRAATLLKAVLARIEAWEDPAIAWDDVLRGLRRIYKRSRDTFQKAADEATAENFHQCRKRTRELRLNLDLIVAVNPTAIRSLAQSARKAGTLLGEEHDLYILEKLLAQVRATTEKMPFAVSSPGGGANSSAGYTISAQNISSQSQRPSLQR